MFKTEFEFGKVLSLPVLAGYTDDKVNFQGIWENSHGGVSLLAFKAGQVLTPHTAPADVMVYVVEGEIEFTMLDMPHTLRSGEFLLMGENVVHSVKANADSKVLLIKIKG